MKLIITFILLISLNILNGQEHILIGDSQTIYLAKHSTKIKQSTKLCKIGIGVIGLNQKVYSHPINKHVKSVSICVGVNDSYLDVGVETLMETVKRTFPNAKIYIIQGSWGWGSVKKISVDKFTLYYKKFEKLGGILIEPPIGNGDPHKNKQIYKKIILELERVLNNDNL